MTDTITRLRELRDDWRAKAQKTKDELRQVAGDPTANRSSLYVYQGEMREALEYYREYLFQRADALLDVAEAARHAPLEHSPLCSLMSGDDFCDCDAARLPRALSALSKDTTT